ncbi:MAG: hypothetical protein U9P36_02465 [Thermodesulfobacteriota bacterium]|nr:hypothetical protein [Thermodesulfobacteriota bacterium]
MSLPKKIMRQTLCTFRTVLLPVVLVFCIAASIATASMQTPAPPPLEKVSLQLS